MKEIIKSNMNTKDPNFFSSLDQHDRIGPYRKDKLSENILYKMNSAISAANIDSIIKGEVNSKKSFPSIIVTGVPRSGTTLITQLLPSHYNLGYSSNLMSRFYLSPLIGAWMQNQLISDDIHGLKIFNSHHGVTDKIYEPHEFGYFWSGYLNTKSSCHDPLATDDFDASNFISLDNDLTSITKVFGKPAVYKCSISPFFLNYFMDYTNTYFIHIVRDRKKAVDSILNVRKKRLGSESNWWGIKPYRWEEIVDLTPREQVEWQYDKTIDAINSVAMEHEDRFFCIELEDLIDNTESTLNRIMENFMSNYNISVEKVYKHAPKLYTKI